MTISEQASARVFPPFQLSRLLQGTFAPTPGQKICVLIDLERPAEIEGFQYLGDPGLSIQRNAHTFIYEALKNGVMEELGLKGGEIFAYQITGGSNLDLPDTAVAPDGKVLSLEGDVYPNYDIILCISTYSATAPLTAFAKQYGFRGATISGGHSRRKNSQTTRMPPMTTFCSRLTRRRKFWSLRPGCSEMAKPRC